MIFTHFEVRDEGRLVILKAAHWRNLMILGLDLEYHNGDYVSPWKVRKATLH